MLNLCLKPLDSSLYHFDATIEERDVNMQTCKYEMLLRVNERLKISMSLRSSK